MAQITGTREIEKIMRSTIIENSEVNPSFVRNLITEFSADLDKDYSSSIFNSISSDNVAILFELLPDDNNANMSEENYNSDIISYYQYFKLKLIIYGDDSAITALKLIARLRSSKIRDDLIGQGVHIAKISEISELNEVINGTIWQRSDFTILLGCEFKIKPVKENYNIEDYTNLNIYKK